MKFNHEDYEKYKRLCCKMIDIAEKHNLSPTAIIEIQVFESYASIGTLKIGKEAFSDWIKIAREEGLFIEKRIDDILERFDTIKGEVKKVPEFKEMLEEEK